jgi:hypothetical protein
MSYTVAIALIAAIDAFVIAALACACLIPFIIDKPTPVTRDVTIPNALPDFVGAVPALD